MIVLICAQWLALFQDTAAQTLPHQISERLRNRIEAAGIPLKITFQGEPIHASVMLPIFYERRAYRPAWSKDSGPLKQVEGLISAIREAGREGLRPGDYHLARIETTLREMRENQRKKKSLDASSLVDVDLLLTDAFLIYGSHLLAGRINPETIDPEWFANRREADLAAMLQSALDSHQIEETLKSLLPPQLGYSRLRQALIHYRHLAEKGGVPIVPEGPKMQKGDLGGERVMALRARLVATGDLGHRSHDGGDLFDDELEQAVVRFQQRHGLDADGVVGPAALAALNVSVEERIRQIEVNMERWRWLPQDLGKRYILVNIANFELEVVDSGQSVMTMRVVVGKNYRRTPVFSNKITYLVLNPYWNIPPGLALQDMLPQLRKDPNSLTEKKHQSTPRLGS
jgi:murein L,D-transpeptidase YcbB/YkuD